MVVGSGFRLTVIGLAAGHLLSGWLVGSCAVLLTVVLLATGAFIHPLAGHARQ